MSTQTKHKKILAKGKPGARAAVVRSSRRSLLAFADDAMAAHRYKKVDACVAWGAANVRRAKRVDAQEALPSGGITGLLNNSGTKVRLSFKTLDGWLWISCVDFV